MFDWMRLLVNLKGWTSITWWASGPFTVASAEPPLSPPALCWQDITKHPMVPLALRAVFIDWVVDQCDKNKKVGQSGQWGPSVVCLQWWSRTRAEDKSQISWELVVVWSVTLWCWYSHYRVCWRPSCAILLSWQEVGPSLCTSDWCYTLVLSIKLDLFCVSPVKRWSLQGSRETQRDTSTSSGWREESGTQCGIKRECVSSSIDTHNNVLPLAHHESRKMPLLVNNILTWNILNCQHLNSWVIFSLLMK